jgi:hypothetical protein
MQWPQLFKAVRLNLRHNRIGSLPKRQTRPGCACHSLPQRAAAAAGLRLRVSEANSAVGGGRAGLSNVFAAALWTADAAFEFAAAGAAGINMHWGVGGKFGHGGPSYTGVQTNFRLGNPALPYPCVHPPWYGYLLFQEATRGSGVRFLAARRGNGSTCGDEVKVRARYVAEQ